jgi:citrate synthase
MIQDPEQKIARPRQIYTGVEHRKIQTTQDEKSAVKVGY